MHDLYSKTHDIQVWEASQNIGILESTDTAVVLPAIGRFSIGQTINYFDNAIDIIVESGKFKRVILLSSGRVYGTTDSPTALFTEVAPYKPYDKKSSDMAMIENAFIFKYKRFSDKFPLVVFRVCEIISEELIKEMTEIIKSHSTRILDYTKFNFIFIADVLQAIWVASVSSFAGKKYNITSREVFSYEDIYDLVADGMIKKTTEPPAKYNRLDGSLMTSELKWEAYTPIKEIIISLKKENE